MKLGENAEKKIKLSSSLQLYYRAFLDLHRRRQWHASGPQPVTYQELAAYIKLKFRMEFAQVNRLVRFVEDLDDAYLKDYSERQASKKP